MLYLVGSLPKAKQIYTSLLDVLVEVKIVTGMGVSIVTAEEAKFTADVNARLDQFLIELGRLPDSGGQNRGNVDRRNLTLRFVEDVTALRT